MNEHDTVLLQGNSYNFFVLPKQPYNDSDNDSIKSDDDDICDDTDILNDIYSDQHHLDTVVPYLSYRFRPDIWCPSFVEENDVN